MVRTADPTETSMIYPPASRRAFLRYSAALAAASGLPEWLIKENAALAADEPAPAKTSNDQINVALIGCGGMGTGDGKNAASKGAKIVAVCDVDAGHLERATKQDFPGAEGYSDFREVMARKDIDAVIVGTVDHWHTLISLAAMKSGKDVYCEKPLTLTIDEGKRLVEMQKQTGRILQTGTQQRSSTHFRM